MYETYVGANDFEDEDDEMFALIREVGNEYGATTGRPRQVSWMSIDMIEKAIKINGANKVVFNKADILDEVKAWCVFDGMDAHDFKSAEDMEQWILRKIDDPEIMIFSRSPSEI